MEMTIWEAMEYLNTLVDDSDPDTSLSQIQVRLITLRAQFTNTMHSICFRLPKRSARMAIPAG